MEYIKENLITVLGITLFVLLSITAYLFLFGKTSIYYTKIDNTNIKSTSSNDNMKYEYTLTSFDENANKKEITFKTSRKLKENAYIKLEVMISREVIGWEEVKFNELPKKVRNNYKS